MPKDASVAALRELLAMHGFAIRACREEVAPEPQRGVNGPSVRLTPQELAVLRAFTYCDGNDQIAAALGISPATVKFHVESLYRKLRVSSRAFAVGRALRLGLMSLEDL